MTASHSKLAAVAALALLLPTPSALAAELACEGVFGIDSSEARLVAHFGREHVVTGEVPGPEGTTMIATTVYPGDPEREFQAVWWHEDTLRDPSFFTTPPGDTAPGGARIGMTVEEVEALNGGPFNILGFGWDYSGSTGFQPGDLSGLPELCFVNVTFEPSVELPADVDPEPISGDKEVRSDLPLLRQVEPRVVEIHFGYPHPDFR